MTIYLTILGIILLLFPFVLLVRFEDKRIGFCIILSFLLVFHLVVAIVTQAFHVFAYPVVLALSLLLCGFAAYKLTFRLPRFSLKSLLRAEYVAVALLTLLAVASLYTVHYRYSGEIDIAVAPYKAEVESMAYPYPYFSDEWFAVAFIQDSIETHSLPTRNPLVAGNPSFINLELPFHSLLAGLMLLLQLDPLIHYSILAIFTGLLTVLLAYVFLRQNQIDRYTAAIAAALLLYITNGGSIWGVWNLIPLTVGMLAMLLGFTFLSARRRGMTLLMAFVTLVFYPPLVVFYTVGFLFHTVAEKTRPFQERVKTVGYYLLSMLGAATLVSAAYFFSKGDAGDFIPYVLSKVFYDTPTPGGFSYYALYDVVPIPILLLAVVGIYPLLAKRLWLLLTTAVGLLYWGLYHVALFRFVIELERVVIVTATLIVLIAGFGLGFLVDFFKKTAAFQNTNVLSHIQLVILAAFLLFVPFYTEREGWRNFKLVMIEDNVTHTYSAPANKYLHPDDLRLFQDIEGKNFLSLPWKGTVIGVTTPNYPAAIKGGTISLSGQLSYDFMAAGCKTKMEIATSKKLQYVYFPEFDCPGFDFVATSSEGLYLYKVSD